ncbi:MAG: alpha/beta hydrolase [Nevskia sp.]|nr:alpha/beta hydrolase [Nevskia sp.]
MSTQLPPQAAAKSPHVRRVRDRLAAVPTTIESRTLRFAGYRTRAVLREGSGPTVLCLHGWSDSADAYRPLMQALSRTDAKLVALDFPGHGEGPRLAPRPQRVLPQMTAFALAAIDHYAAHAPLILLGHSLGGRTALAAAVQRQRQVAAVLALAPAPLRLRLWLRAVAAERWLIPRAARLLGLLPDAWARRRYLQGHRRTFFAPDMVDPQVFADFARYCDARRMAQYTAGLHRIGGELGESLELRALTMPVDLVWGRNDTLVPPAAARAYRAQIPHARYVELDNCGHNPAQEQTAWLAARLRELLASLQSS